MNALLTRLDHQASTKPGAIALRSGNQSLTYAQLMVVVRQIAQRLRSHRVKSLGLYLDNGIDWIVIDLAAMLADIRVVPLPWFFSDLQIAHAIAAGCVGHLGVANQLPKGIAAGGARAKLYDASWLQPIAAQTVAPSTDTAPGGKLSFTSGSTGKPRGIELSYEFIGQTCESILAAISGLPVESHLSILPYATLLENTAGVYVPLMLGKTVYAESAAIVGLSADLRLDPARLVQIFNRIQPHSLILTPQLLEVFCALVESKAIDPACLVFVAVGGARVGETLMQRARRARIPAYEGYGLTEFGSVAILNTPQNHRPGSVGKPLPGTRVDIAADGEIVLSTAVSTEATADRPYRTLNTGDLGSIDADGFVYIRGRKSNLIVLSTGRNVAPEWIETELNSSPLILQSYVFAESGAQLSALLVAAGASVTNSELDVEIERINRGLPAYARVGNYYRLQQAFSTGNQMLTTNGRLCRPQIQQSLPMLMEPSESPAPSAKARATDFSFQEINPC